MKSRSISRLILPLLAFASAHCLNAQSLVVDKTALTLSGLVGGAPVTQTINLTSSTGAPIQFALVVPQSASWLKVGGQSSLFSGVTPATVTISADPTGLAAGTYPANPPASISVMGGTSSNNSPIQVTFNVSAIGVNPNSVAFTYTSGSNNFPVTVQNITLNSATTTHWTATATTTSGGNWFTVPQPSGDSPGNLAVILNTSVVATLALNTYTGTVTVTPPAGQGPPATVSVTLTVVATPPVTFDPASLIFNWQTGTSNPVQTLTVYSSQPLNVGVQGIVDTGTWSFSLINTGSGQISATGTLPITVTLNPNGLGPGTYTGRLRLLTPGGNPAQQDVPVKLVVSNTPLLNVPNATLNFTGQLGNTPASQSVNITSTGTALNYSVSTANYNPTGYSTWLIVNNAGDTTTPLTVSVKPAGLPPGTYTATINVLSAAAGSTAQQIPVVLKVTNDPTISASVSALSFPYQMGQSAPAARTIKITSLSGVPLNYSASPSTITTNCATGWLLLNGAVNTINGATPPNDTLTVSVTTAGLAAGTCTGKITITATNPATGAAAVGSPFNIDVTLFVSTTAQLVLTPPDPPVFSVGVGPQSPAPQTITLGSTNSDVLTYTVAFQPLGSWLSVNTPGGTTAAGNNSVTLSVNPNGLAAATYSGTVTLTATGPGGAAVANSPVTVPVTLNVTAGLLTLSSSDLSFQQTIGGPVPAAQTVTIGSNGQPLNYTALANSNNAVTWLSVSPTSGNTSTSGALTISVDGSKLAQGNYTGTIQLTSPLAGNSPLITVKLKVDPGTISAPTTTLTFTQVAGGAVPPSQNIAVTGSPAPLNFTVASATFNGGNWLSATPPSGTTPSSVQVLINVNTLPVGQYSGTVTITSAGANGSPKAVPVVLNVIPPAFLTVSPTSLSFASTIGLAAPPAQSLRVTSTGATGNVPITTVVLYDGAAGQWLTVAPATANSPATLAISVAPANLPAGTYVGHVIVASTSAILSVSIPVTLNVTSIPRPLVSSVANAASYSTGAVSPGENIVIFGSGIGPADITKAVVANNVFPTVVGNTRVLFDNIPAPVLYASAGQTSVMVPYGIFGRTTTNIVVEYAGVQSAPINQIVGLAAPGIYTLNQQGTGPGAILNQDGITVNGRNAREARGNIIAIYMTGEGQTTPQGADGAVIPPVATALKKPNLPVTVTIGGVDAPVVYAGSAPGLISGVMQVNVTIPLTAPTGPSVAVVVTVGTAKSQSGDSAATVAIQESSRDDR